MDWQPKEALLVLQQVSYPHTEEVIAELIIPTGGILNESLNNR